MRLLPKEIKDIKDVIALHLKQAKAKLYLFGSQTKDSAKGGDIDLLLVTDKMTVERLKKIKVYIQVDLKEKLDDQRVDLIIATQNDLKDNVFYESIFQSAELIGEWN